MPASRQPEIGATPAVGGRDASYRGLHAVNYSAWCTLVGYSGKPSIATVGSRSRIPTAMKRFAPELPTQPFECFLLPQSHRFTRAAEPAADHLERLRPPSSPNLAASNSLSSSHARPMAARSFSTSCRRSSASNGSAPGGAGPPNLHFSEAHGSRFTHWS
jgi:hypothetical protein